jgi:restriction system protein
MSVPKYNEVYREVLEAIKDGKEHKISHIRDFVAKVKDTSEEERAEMLKSNVSVFDSRVGWSRAYLKAAGFVVYPKRGLTQITELGKKAITSNRPINNDYLLKYGNKDNEQFRTFFKTELSSSEMQTIENTSSETTPQESMENAFSRINSTLGDELLTEIMSREPKFFEHLVVDLLMKMGYGGVLDDSGTVTSASHDEGIDGIIREDKLGFSNIFIQAKRYALDRSVNRPEIQAFVGAIVNKGGKGLFITTSKFTEGAKKYAKENHIVLVDGIKLAELMIEYNLGVGTVQTFEIKKIDTDYFSEE